MNNSTGVPPAFAPLIQAAADAAAAAEADLAKMSKDERLEHHRKKLDTIGYFEGAEGVARYKKEHPEAAELGTRLIARTYRPKPRGYTAYLAELAENWLTMWVAVSSTNREDVERLNAHLGRTFNPDNHFNAQLTPKRLEKIAAVFAKHGANLDTSKVKTMSQVRQVAKAHWVRTNADKPIGNIAVISGDNLVIGGRRLPIQKNGERDCIRLQIEGKRRRLYLDDLQLIADLMDDGPAGPVSVITTTSSIGELAYSAGEPEIDPLADIQISEVAYVKPSSPLSERIAALKAAQEPQSTTCPDDTTR